MCRLDAWRTQQFSKMGKRGGGETSGEREERIEMDNWRSSAKKKRKIWTMQREGRTNEEKKNVGLEREPRERREERK